VRAGGRSLSVTLGRWIGLSTALSLVVFAVMAALVLQFAEEQEAQEEQRLGEAVEEEDEAFIQVAMAMLVAAPIGVLLAVGSAQWLSRRAVERVTVVSATATRMTADRLGERLPVSPVGDELDALAVALNGLFARLADGVALQRQFAADASHELRSPLAVLSSTLEVARRRPRAGEEWEAVADRALAEVQHMTRLVEALLQLARAGTIPRSETVVMPALLQAVVERAAAAARQAGVQLQVDVDASLAVRGNRELLAVALGNIVANAIAHSPAGAEVRVEARVEASAGAGEVCVRVADQGPGVAVQERERIFHPFVRGDAAMADRGGVRVGLGLGLAIARRVVEAHGGQIFVDGEPPSGAIFMVRLPRLLVESTYL